MKKLLLGLLFMLATVTVSAQTDYENYKSYVRSLGYNIGTEQRANLSQGQTAYTWLNFSPAEYKIVAMSNDHDVTDIDITVYNSNGEILVQDADASDLAVVTFTVWRNTQLKVVIKNYSSNTPYYESTCRYFVAYY